MIYPKRIFAWAFALILSWAAVAGAVDLFGSSTISLANPNDPNTWPSTFNGAPSMGPYAWVDGPTHLQKDPQMANGVFAGQEGTTRIFVCRAKMSDGAHPGKFFMSGAQAYCNVGWGGVEKVYTSGYELLVNKQPQNAKFLSQTWVSPATAASATFTGGSVGTKAMRVARASYNNGVHAGKEWEGKCNIGWGGKEVPLTSYEVLSLGFDKAAWQAAQGTTQMTDPQIIITGLPTSPPPNLNLNPPPIQTQSSPVVVSYTPWTPDNLGIGLADLANRIPNLLNTMIDQYNAALTDPALRKDRQTLVTALKNGDTDAQGIVAIKMVEFAKAIVNRDPATWSSEESEFIKFLQALAQNQRHKAGNLADQAFKAWQLQEATKEGQTIFDLINPAVNPPPEILAMAKNGYAVTPDIGPNVAKIIAGSAGAVTAVGGSIVAGLTGLGGSIIAGISTTVAGSMVMTGGAAAGSGASIVGAATATVAGAVAVVALMVTSGVLKGIEVFQYQDYRNQLNAAVADSKNPVSVAQLKNILNSDDGQKAVLMWFATQAATGSH